MFEDRPIPNLSLSARNVVWVMLFSPFLEEAAISCDVSSEDLDFLVEYRLIFNDLSKVKRLAICFRFVCKESDQSTWWGSPSEQNFKIGNKKTASVALFLRCLSDLISLEIATAGKIPDLEILQESIHLV